MTALQVPGSRAGRAERAVVVRGAGALADAIRDGISGPGGVAVDILVAAGYDPAGTAAAGAAAYRTGRASLPVRAEPGRVTIGPLAVPPERGCLTCLLRREEAVRAAAPDGPRQLWQGWLAGTVPPTAPALAAPLRQAVAALVAGECAALSGRPSRGGRGGIVEVDALSLAVCRRTFLADPQCPVCGHVPDDDVGAGTPALEPRRPTAPGGLRLRDLVAEYDRLVDTYVDARCGIVPAVTAGDVGSLVFASAPACRPGQEPVEGYGRTVDYRSGTVVAIAEALERLGGLHPRGRRTRVRASFRQLGLDAALDPLSLGLPQGGVTGRRPGHGIAYGPDVPLDWVHAYSFRRGGPILVPAGIAYYGECDQQIAYECSNGCALGGCLEEAILHGIFEVAERDAFLISWYARLPLPRVDPRTSTDPVNRMLVRRVERDTGCRLDAFDATMPEGLPSLFLVLVDEADRPGFPKAYCGAGAHLDPERALRGGLLEVGGAYRLLADHLRREPERADRLAADPDFVVAMEDHALTYAARTSWPRLGFLYRGGGVRSMTEAFPPWARHRPAGDLLADLRRVVDRYLAGGLDVIVVDQTADEHRAADLHCVKVIIPGTLPMTFGHRNRRTDGLPRLREAPIRLGYRTAPLSEDEINPHPHPFP